MAFRFAYQRVYSAGRKFASKSYAATSSVAFRRFASAGTGLTLACTGLIVMSSNAPSKAAAPAAPSKAGDYNAVKASIASILDEPGFDDGSLGPVFVRLAWHASGTYSQFDKSTTAGGSGGGTMRFQPESGDGANAGLHIARAKLEKVKALHPWISYGDLWTLAGAVAIEEMGGPKIQWRGGRVDVKPDDKDLQKKVPPNGRLPDAVRNADHIRAIFYRMGFNDREIVALCGAHAIGRCHRDRSGFDGPWTRAPTTFSNEFYRVLLEEKWVEVKLDNGVKQFMNAPKKDIMMLPADMELLRDPDFKKYTDLYAKDEKAFFDDFAKAFAKLLELGVTFPKSGWW